MNWDSVIQVLKDQGPLAIVLVVVLYLFYDLIWKVWSKAMESKDKEIERLTELNKQLLERVLSQDNSTLEKKKEG